MSCSFERKGEKSVGLRKQLGLGPVLLLIRKCRFKWACATYLMIDCNTVQ